MKYTNYGELIRKRRTDLEIPIMSIAKKTGLSYSCIRQIETGFANGGICTVDTICHAIRFPIPIGILSSCDTPTPFSFVDFIRDQCSIYGNNLEVICQKSEITLATLANWMTKSINVSIISADDFCQRLGITYVLGGGYNLLN